MRAIAYVRVSTEGQATEGLSLDAQRDRLEGWAKGAGAELVAVYCDAGISGKKAANRPGLQSALDDVTSRPGGALVIYSLSRLARNVRDTLAIAERLDRAGADLVSLSERIDTTSASGKMLFRMLSVMAEFERDLVSERTLGIMSHKRSLGQRLGEVPFGHRLGVDGVTLEVDPAEQAALAQIRAWASAGLRSRAIARRLDEAGIPPKGGARRSEARPPKDGRTGWRHQSVDAILRREGFKPLKDMKGSES